MKAIKLALLAISSVQGQQYIVSTVAGGIPPPTPVAALQASIEAPYAVALDSAGNLYFASENCVLKKDAKGTITRVAGTSQPGFSGDNGPATGAQLSAPIGLALDGSGNLYISDSGNNRVRKVSPNGIITTTAGGGAGPGYGNGGPATSAQIDYPVGLAIDSSGNLYIAEYQTPYSVRMVSPAGIITTFAGGNGLGFSGDGGPATSAQFWNPFGLAMDGAGNLYIADSDNHRVRKVSTSGIISTVVGPGPGPQSFFPMSVAASTSGDVYFDYGFSIGKLSSGGTLSTLVGEPINTTVIYFPGFSGDGGPAADAQVCEVYGLAVDTNSNLYFADICNNRIRTISSGGIINTVVGNGTAGYSGDGGPAANAQLSISTTIATDAAGNLYIADAANSRVRMVNSAGVITTVAGNGTPGFSGDGGPAISAQLYSPFSLAVDAGNNLYVSDGLSQDAFQVTSRIRKVSPVGTISTVAGAGPTGDTGDGGAAISAQIYAGPLAVDAGGNLYVADNTDSESLDSQIRKISPSGIITTILIPSVLGIISTPVTGIGFVNAMTTDGMGNVVFSTGLLTEDNLVREVAASTGAVINLAGIPPGTLLPAYGSAPGDGGLATNAQLADPTGVAFDSSGNLFIADQYHNSIRMVSPGGIISTIAGSGSFGGSSVYSGDGGLALLAQLKPGTLALGTNGKIYFTDGNAVRVLTPTGCTYTPSVTTLQLSPTGGALPITLTTGAGCLWTIIDLPDWITISGASTTFSGSAPITLTVAANTGAPRSAVIYVAGEMVSISQASDQLLLSQSGVVNSANYGSAVAPGSIVSIFGNFPLAAPIAVSGFPIPTNLGGLSIQFGSESLAPLFYASTGQVNAQIPWEATDEGVVDMDNGQTAGGLSSLYPYAPGIYSTNGQGTGQGAILDTNYQLVDASNPAIAGTSVVQIFCTGLGAVTSQPSTGAPSPGNPLAETTSMPSVTMGGVPATVQFSGLTPGFVGLYQVNALVPAQTAGMGTVPVVVSIGPGQVQSNTVTMSVQ